MIFGFVYCTENSYNLSTVKKQKLIALCTNLKMTFSGRNMFFFQIIQFNFYTYYIYT
jgi:hypothetical protein